MHIHNDKKPLACPHCDFRARQRHSLDYHLERYHKELATEQKKNKVMGNSQVSTEFATSEGAVNDEVTPEETANTWSNPATPEHTTNENNSETAETDTVDA
ncbi:hypothetical protein NP493_87g04034 [Ridgeia piscesae]|uniref:C2H2-type domain-containing protein n=1 Tax=Ridgeia piscesae TaxID=27915 RepID=A0AAD9P8I6_RIDPI|nr:hypothetical protein NP493_87g04034 [Ridgeia piscesae]